MRDSVTGKYLSNFYEHTVTYDGPVIVYPDSPIESVAHISENGFVYFTITTAAGPYNRIKVSLLNDLNTYLTYTNDFSVNENGKYVWKISVVQRSEDTTYSFDLRSSETGKYLKKYADYLVPVGETGDVVSTVFKSVTSTVSNGKLTFTVETYKGYDRVKVSLKSNPNSYITYATKHTETDDAYVWTLTVDAPDKNTDYSFAARNVGGSSYLAERYNYTFEAINYPAHDVWGTIDANGLYTSINGGYQISLPGWVYFGVVDDCETVAASYNVPTSCLFTKIYDVVDSDTFENYTKENFEEILEMSVTSFRKTTVGKHYTCYVVLTEAYLTYVFQTADNRYFLNFAQANDGVDVTTVSYSAMTGIVIYY